MFQKIILCLSSNGKKVLAALLEHKQAVSAQHLADQVGLSISQVRYSIKKIGACLTFAGIEVQQKPNEGILLVANEKEKKELREALQSMDVHFSALNQNERFRLLLQILLTDPNNYTLSEIRALTKTSYTSFYRDLDKVKEWLQSFSLSLVNRRNGPLKIKGEELKVREAVQEVLFQNLGQEYLIQACVLPVEEIELVNLDKSAFFIQSQKFIQNMRLPACEKHIRSLEVKTQRRLFDRVHFELSLYLGVALSRLRTGNYLKKAVGVGVASSEKLKREAGLIWDALVDDIQREQLDQEKAHLAFLLEQCFQYGVNESGQGEREVLHIGKKKNRVLANQIVKEIAKYLHAGLYEDRQLIQCIEWELEHFQHNGERDEFVAGDAFNPEKPASTIEQVLMRILTPMLKNEDFTQSELMLRRMCNHARTALERVRAASFQRRVLLVCGAGVATAFSLRSQLNTRFPQIDVVDMVSVFELVHKLNLIEGCDAIISTVPLGSITPITQIHVNSFLSDEDVENIKNTLGLEQSQSLSIAPPPNQSYTFQEILNEKVIETDVNANLPSRVIEEVGRLLLEVDAIWPSYIKAMQDLYSLYGAYMVIAPNTALLHAGPEMGSKKLAISLVTLHSPIHFGHKVFDPVRIAMAFSSPVNSVHTSTLSEIFNFFAVAENRERIIRAANAREVLSVLQKTE